MSITLRQVLNAVKTTLAPVAADASRAQTMETITEGMNTLPTVQIYVDEWDTTAGSETDRKTMRAEVRVTALTIFVDVYVRQRSQLGEDMAAVVDKADEIIPILEAQKVKPYFALEGIKAFRWNGKRVTFVYGDQATAYVGMRFTLTFTIF